jgi:hypothetical protein
MDMEKIQPTWQDTKNYIKLYHTLKQKPSSGSRYIGDVSNIILEKNIQSIWDYGCGVNCLLIKGVKKKFPDFNISGYDPAILNDKPFVHNYITTDTVDMIVSTDCLEHLRIAELKKCFKFWKQKNPKYIFVATINRLAHKTLPDKTNPHKTIESKDWWIGFLQAHFWQYKLNEKYTRMANDERFTIFLEKV